METEAIKTISKKYIKGINLTNYESNKYLLIIWMLLTVNFIRNDIL